MHGLRRHIDRATRLRLPGPYTPLYLGQAHIGYVLPDIAARLQGAGAAAASGTLRLEDAAALSRAAVALAAAAVFKPRHELFDVRAHPGGAVLAQLDRGALPVLGISAEGVHLNGLVHTPHGLMLWVGLRRASKALDPGKLDHLVAGGIPAGLDPMQTLIKEAWEEASLPAALVRQAVPTGTLAYDLERGEGLRRDRLHCFDLALPQAFQPTPRDDEVERFFLMSLPDIAARLRETDEFKFNVAFVLIDLLARHGLADPALVAPLRRQADAGQPA